MRSVWESLLRKELFDHLLEAQRLVKGAHVACLVHHQHRQLVRCLEKSKIKEFEEKQVKPRKIRTKKRTERTTESKKKTEKRRKKRESLEEEERRTRNIKKLKREKLGNMAIYTE